MTNCVAFCDPAGGSGGDSMTIAWAHADGKKVILDGVVEKRPPFSPRTCVEEFSEILKRHGITRVTGDRFSGEWVREAFRECGIHYEVSGKTKSELYAAFLVLANSGLVQIPLHRRLISQLQRLERRMLRSGRESIDHGAGAHDDLSNAACGALVLASTGSAARAQLPTLGIHVLHVGRFGESIPIPESICNRQPSLDPFDDTGFSPRGGSRWPSFGRGRCRRNWAV